jgi:Xaa-Pro aminopeptidase
MVKSPEEIANIKISCNIACGGIEMLKKYIKPGVSEKQAAQKLLCYFVQHGASEQSFPAIISFGDHSSDIHSVPTERKYKKGENILVDCGCVYNGYCSDITRC